MARRAKVWAAQCDIPPEGVTSLTRWRAQPIKKVAPTMWHEACLALRCVSSGEDIARARGGTHDQDDRIHDQDASISKDSSPLSGPARLVLLSGHRGRQVPD